MTNNHCISDQAGADQVDIEFSAEGSSCDEQCNEQLACKGKVVATSTKLLATGAMDAADFALLQLPNGTDLSAFGFFQLRESGPVEKEEIYIAQHPGGWGKRIAAVLDDGTPAVVDKLGVDGECGKNNVGYMADTQGGSSGSPVVAAKDNLGVALHHCGGCDNLASDIRDVIYQLKRNKVDLKDMIAV